MTINSYPSIYALGHKAIRETQADIAKEESTYIKERLFHHFWPQISRGVIAGLPEWYKAELAQTEFTPTPENQAA